MNTSTGLMEPSATTHEGSLGFALFAAGVSIAVGADDPLLFGPRLVSQYEIARDVHGFTPAELAALARMSVHGSAAPGPVRSRLLDGIDAWQDRPGRRGLAGS